MHLRSRLGLKYFPPRKARLMLAILLSGLVILSPHACATRAEVVDILVGTHHEEPQEPIMVDRKLALQFYRGPKTWTLTSIEPDGTVCVIAAGTGWESEKL